MNVLILSRIIPYPLAHGSALRTFNLSRELGRNHEVSLVAMVGERHDLHVLRSKGIYKNISLIAKPREGLSWKRHFRLSDRGYHKISSGAHYRWVIDSLQRMIEQGDIDLVIAVTLKMAEYVRSLKGVKRVVDDYDCNTLTFEREIASEGSGGSVRQRWKSRLSLIRIKKYEGTLIRDFDGVTTISPVDRRVLAKLNNVPIESIGLAPNGVDNELLDRVQNNEYKQRSVAFWGSLDFPPNRTAVEYFFNKIFKPYLSPKGVQWYVVGRARTWLPKALFGAEPNIHLTGYVDDLYSLIEVIPVMVNPMIMGSGLKNKVLEAFMLGCGVVSTSLGMESIDAEDGTHCVIRDDPAAFAAAVLDLLDDPGERSRLSMNGTQLVREKYTWNRIGENYTGYLEEIMCG